jgi:hypothetical protein
MDRIREELAARLLRFKRPRNLPLPPPVNVNVEFCNQSIVFCCKRASDE